MSKYLVWKDRSDISFEDIQKIGVFVEAKDHNTARSGFASASGVYVNDVRAMGPDEFAENVRKTEERKAKKIAQQSEQPTSINASGALCPEQLGLKYYTAGKTRSIREWITAAIEAELIVQQISDRAVNYVVKLAKENNS